MATLCAQLRSVLFWDLGATRRLRKAQAECIGSSFHAVGVLSLLNQQCNRVQGWRCFFFRGKVIPATTRGLEWGVLQGRREGLKWYTDHCTPALAIDLFVLPGLCFQSLSTFYCRLHCRPLNHFGLSVSHQTRKLWPLRVPAEHKDEMNCSIKVWPLV